jgi:hypothetical protein
MLGIHGVGRREGAALAADDLGEAIEGGAGDVVCVWDAAQQGDSPQVHQLPRVIVLHHVELVPLHLRRGGRCEYTA